MILNPIIRRAIELFSGWDEVPADDATDEEWDAAFEAHRRETEARKAAGKEVGSDFLRRIEAEWKSFREDC